MLFLRGKTPLCQPRYAKVMPYSVCIQKGNHNFLFHIYLVLLFLLPLVSNKQMLYKHPNEQKMITIPNISPLPHRVSEKCPIPGGPGSFGQVSALRHCKMVCVNAPAQDSSILFLSVLFSLNVLARYSSKSLVITLDPFFLFQKERN